MIELNEKMTITLPKGGELEIEMSLEFRSIVCNKMGVTHEKLTEDHIRMFVWGALKSAVDKAELEKVDGGEGKPT